MLVPCGRQPNATCTPFAFQLLGVERLAAQVEPAEQTRVQVRDVLVLPRSDRDDLRVRVPQENLDELDGGVTGPAQNRDLHLVHCPLRTTWCLPVKYITMPEPMTITDAAGFIRRGELTPVGLLEQCLARIDRYEDRVRAWVYLDRDGAREQAARLTAELKQNNYRGPLHGIPIGIKDIIDVFDMPTGCGSKLWANSYARRDATVRRAVAAGRRGHHGQDGDDRVRELRPAGDAEPVEPGPHARRQFERLGRGGRVRHVPRRTGDANRRLDHPPRELLRRVQHQADLRPRERRWRAAAGPEHGPRRRDGELRAGLGDHLFGAIAGADERDPGTRKRRSRSSASSTCRAIPTSDTHILGCAVPDDCSRLGATTNSRTAFDADGAEGRATSQTNG